MHPVLLELGPIVIYSMWFMATIGVIVSGIVFIKLAERHRLKLNFILDHSIYIIIAGIVGARALFIAKNVGYYFYQFGLENFLSIFYLWDKGLSAWGGIIGIGLALIYFCKRDNQSILRWLDVLFISVMIGFIFGNIGTFLEGSVNYGKETALPWGIKIEGPTIKYSIPIHPTQLYAAIYTFLIAAMAMFAFFKKSFKKDGNIFLAGGLIYTTMVFLEEFLRGDDVMILFNLREGQIISGAAFITICIILLIRYNKLAFLRFNKKRK